MPGARRSNVTGTWAKAHSAALRPKTRAVYARVYEPIDVIDVDEERVISVIRVIGQSEKFGTHIDAEWAWLIRARGGKGIDLRTFTDRAQALEAVNVMKQGPPR